MVPCGKTKSSVAFCTLPAMGRNWRSPKTVYMPVTPSSTWVLTKESAPTPSSTCATSCNSVFHEKSFHRTSIPWNEPIQVKSLEIIIWMSRSLTRSENSWLTDKTVENHEEMLISGPLLSSRKKAGNLIAISLTGGFSGWWGFVSQDLIAVSVLLPLNWLNPLSPMAAKSRWLYSTIMI